MLGLDPSIQESLGDRVVQVVPVGILPLDQADLPSTAPALEVSFALSGESGVLVRFHACGTRRKHARARAVGPVPAPVRRVPAIAAAP